MATGSNYVSVSRRPPDVEDYIDMLRRYRSWIIGPAFAGLVVSVVVSFLWPDTYRSTAVLRITPPKVSERLVPSEMSQRMSERLNQMQQEILSRGQLTALIKQPALDLYKKEQQQKPLEDVVTDMRNKYIQIHILNVPGSDTAGKVASAFSITFEYIDRYKAKQVVDQLVSKFMEQNIKVLQNNTRATTAFLDDELKTAADHLNELSQKITKFKMENQGKLPEQAQANVAMVNSLQQAVATENEGLNRTTNERMMKESQINGLQNELAYQSQHVEDTVLTGGGPGQLSVKNQRLVELERELSNLNTQLSEARKMYRDDYPPIKSMMAKIDNLQKQKEDVEGRELAASALAGPAGPTPPTAVRVTNPQVQQRMEDLKNQIASAKTALTITNNEIQSRQNHITELNRRILEYQVRIEAAPLNEQQYAQLMGDYQLAKAQYDEFTKRKEQSDTQESMNEHQAGGTRPAKDWNCSTRPLYRSSLSSLSVANGLASVRRSVSCSESHSRAPRR
ncbi:Lipopolysaccharide biosynthesis [Candidatus Sulfopaludibacter sp. SbA3]|nr:Lipopolysaccharide biosynthesis [Candidatus Sulfopaludibacter sp. SbA3]